MICFTDYLGGEKTLEKKKTTTKEVSLALLFIDRHGLARAGLQTA